MTTNDLRVGERMQHRSGVTYYSSRPLCNDLAVVIKRFPGRAATSRCFVLVHGIGVSSRYFHPLTTELAKNGEVFLIDLAGYGAVPDPKRDVPIERHADVLGNLLQRVGIENPMLIAPTVNPPDRRFSTEDRLPSIEARTLALRGDSDPIVPRSETDRGRVAAERCLCRSHRASCRDALRPGVQCLPRRETLGVTGR